MKKPSPVTVSYLSLGLAALALILAILGTGCRMPTEGAPLDGSTSSSTDTGSDTTAAPLDSGSPSESVGVTSDPVPQDRLPHPDDDSSSTGQPALTSESSSGEESSSSTGDAPYDSAHCDADCPRMHVQHDVNADGCICGWYCTEDVDCEGPTTCEGGRCGIACKVDDDCPSAMVCGTMPGNGAVACLWAGEP